MILPLIWITFSAIDKTDGEAGAYVKKILYLLPILCGFTSLQSLALGQTVHDDRPIVAQYFGVWAGPDQDWQNKFRDTTPFTKLTRLYITDAKIVKATDNHFTIAYDDMQRFDALLARVRTDNPLAEIFVSITGDAHADSYGGAVLDNEFAENVAGFLHKYNLNGVDIDWRGGLSKDKVTLLLKNLHDVLHPAGYLLTMEAWQFVSPSYDVPVIKDYLDQINIMSYGTGISLDVCTSDYLRSGFTAKQIIGSIESETGYRKYGGTTDTLGPNGSIRKKVDYAKQAGLAGVANWRLDNDYADKSNSGYPEYKAALELWDALN